MNYTACDTQRDIGINPSAGNGCAYYTQDEFAEGKKLREMLESMCDGGYAMVVQVSKKGPNLLGAFRNAGMWPKCDPNTYFCSEKLLGSPDFVRVLREQVKIGRTTLCIFDDSVRYGRKLHEVCCGIRSKCAEHGIENIHIQVKVIAKQKDFNPQDIYIDEKDFTYLFSGDHDELQVYAKKTLLTLYHYRYLYSIAAPKTHVVEAELPITEAHLTACDMIKRAEGESLSLLTEIGITMWERFMGESELRDAFGTVLGAFYKNASVEAYVGGSFYPSSGCSQLVARASISRLSVAQADHLIDALSARYLRNNDAERADLTASIPELKYEVLNYILSMLAAFHMLGVETYRFDTSDMGSHYGKAARMMFDAFCLAAREDYAQEKDFMAETFYTIGGSIQRTIALDAPYTAQYIDLLTEIFNGESKHDVTLSNYSMFKSVIDMQTAISPRQQADESKDLFFYDREVPIITLIHYLESNGLKNVASIRNDSVVQQILGKLTISTRIGKIGTYEYIEKYAKVGELAATLNSLAQNILMALRNDDYRDGFHVPMEKASSLMAPIRVNNELQNFIKFLKWCDRDKIKGTVICFSEPSSQIPDEMDMSFSDFDIIGSKKSLLYDAYQRVECLIVNKVQKLKEATTNFKIERRGVDLSSTKTQKSKLKKLWPHMAQLTNLINKLESLSDTDTAFLDKFFFSDDWVEIAYSKELDCKYTPGVEYSENFVFDLNGDAKLLLRACVIIVSDAGNSKKKRARPVDHNYAWIFENFSDRCYSEFDKIVRMIYLNSLLGDD